MPGKKRLAGLLVAGVAAVTISACGSSTSDKTIDPADANTLQTALSAVQSAVESGNCRLAQAKAGDFVDAVNQLPETVGTDNKNQLRAVGVNLEKLAQDRSQCQPRSTTGASGPTGAATTTSTPTTTVAPVTTTPTTTPSTASAPAAPPPSRNAGGNSGGNAGGNSGAGGPPTGTPPGGGNTGTGGGAAGGGGGTGTGGTGAGGGGTG